MANIRSNVSGFKVTVDGTTHPIYRDVCHRHPADVHAALGTESESDLQGTLDGLSYDSWFAADGRYLGDDHNGIGLSFVDRAEDYIPSKSDIGW